MNKQFYEDCPNCGTNDYCNCYYNCEWRRKDCDGCGEEKPPHPSQDHQWLNRQTKTPYKTV